MRTFGTLIVLLALASVALAGGKTPGPDTTHKNTKGKGHTQHQGNGYGHHKGDTNGNPDCSDPGRPGRGARPGGNANSRSEANAVGIGGSAVANGGAGGNGYGGSATGGSATGGTGLGGNAAASTGPVTAGGGSASIQGVQGGSATVNVSGGQPGASGAISIDNGDSVWLPQVWRPNAFLTPWCPQPIPAEAVQPVAPADPVPGDYPAPRFWFGGKWYIVE